MVSFATGTISFGSSNGIAQTTPTEAQLAGSLLARCAAFDIPVEEVSGVDLAETLAAAARAVDATRAERRPHAVISRAMRLGPHSKGDDTRAPDLLQAAWAQDPVARLRQQVGSAAETIDREVAELLRGVLAAALAGIDAP